MHQFLIAPRARNDLYKIWVYSVKTWDEATADRYVRQIAAAFRWLADVPERGRSCDHIRRGYRKYLIGSHIVFYRVLPERISIIRILHRKMDFERHLP